MNTYALLACLIGAKPENYLKQNKNKKKKKRNCKKNKGKRKNVK